MPASAHASPLPGSPGVSAPPGPAAASVAVSVTVPSHQRAHGGLVPGARRDPDPDFRAGLLLAQACRPQRRVLPQPGIPPGFQAVVVVAPAARAAPARLLPLQ